jgi:hypothetical protein
MTLVTVVEVESFVSRKLFTQYYYNVTDDGTTMHHHIGTSSYPCSETQANNIASGAALDVTWTDNGW